MSFRLQVCNFAGQCVAVHPLQLAAVNAKVTALILDGVSAASGNQALDMLDGALGLICLISARARRPVMAQKCPQVCKTRFGKIHVEYNFLLFGSLGKSIKQFPKLDSVG